MCSYLLRLLWCWKGSKDNDCKKTGEGHKRQRYKTKVLKPNELAGHFDIAYARVKVWKTLKEPVVGRDASTNSCEWNGNFPDALGFTNQRNDQNDCKRIHHEALKPAQATRLVVNDFRKVQTAKHARGGNGSGEWSCKWRKGRESVLSPRLRTSEHTSDKHNNCSHKQCHAEHGKKQFKCLVIHGS